MDKTILDLRLFFTEHRTDKMISIWKILETDFISHVYETRRRFAILNKRNGYWLTKDICNGYKGIQTTKAKYLPRKDVTHRTLHLKTALIENK